MSETEKSGFLLLWQDLEELGKLKKLREQGLVFNLEKKANPPVSAGES